MGIDRDLRVAFWLPLDVKSTGIRELDVASIIRNRLRPDSRRRT
jgi:hypothetical protein